MRLLSCNASISDYIISNVRTPYYATSPCGLMARTRHNAVVAKGETYLTMCFVCLIARYSDSKVWSSTNSQICKVSLLRIASRLSLGTSILVGTKKTRWRTTFDASCLRETGAYMDYIFPGYHSRGALNQRWLMKKKADTL